MVMYTVHSSVLSVEGESNISLESNVLRGLHDMIVYGSQISYTLKFLQQYLRYERVKALMAAPKKPFLC